MVPVYCEKEEPEPVVLGRDRKTEERRAVEVRIRGEFLEKMKEALGRVRMEYETDAAKVPTS